MAEDQAIRVFFEARQDIQFFFNFYVVVLVVVIGWLITHRDLAWYFRIFLFVGLGVFIGMNLVGLCNSYEILEAAQKDLKGTSPADNPNIVKALQDFTIRRPVVYTMHGIIDLLAIALIFRNEILRLMSALRKN